MREFMTFYENYAEPLTERYFPEKLGTVQQYIEDFKQRDQRIGTALARQNKYMNNRIEQDHHFIKKRVRAMLGFKSFRSAKIILSGIELMHMLRKAQFNLSKELQNALGSLCPKFE